MTDHHTTDRLYLAHRTDDRELVSRMFLRADTIPAEPERAIVDGLAYGGLAVGIVGREGSGKSTLLRAAAAGLSLGVHPWTGERIEPASTYWIGEERPAQWRAKLDRFPHNPKRIRFANFSPHLTPDALYYTTRRHRVGMVVIDPAFCLLGKVGNEYGQELRTQIQPWLPSSNGPAVMMVLHAHRERELRRDAVSHYHGSVAWGAVLDALIDWLRPDDLADTRRTLAVSGKSRIDALPSGRRTALEYCRCDDGDVYLRADTEPRTGDAPRGRKRGGRVDAEAVGAQVREYLAAHPGASWTATARAVGVSRGGDGASTVAARSAFDAGRS